MDSHAFNNYCSKYFYSCLVSHTTPRFYLATVEKNLVRVRVRVNMGVAGNEATFLPVLYVAT